MSVSVDLQCSRCGNRSRVLVAEGLEDAVHQGYFAQDCIDCRRHDLQHKEDEFFRMTGTPLEI